MRTLDDVRLPFGGLTVLIGENGSGKSTLLEAMELLREVAAGESANLSARHPEFSGMIRQGAQCLRLSADIETTQTPGTTLRLRYEIALGHSRETLEESLRDADGTAFFNRHGDQVSLASRWKGSALTAPPQAPLLPSIMPPRMEGVWVQDALKSIRVHCPFPVEPTWARPQNNRGTETLGQVRPLKRLERFGENLVSAWFHLKNDRSDEHWRETLRLVRLGLGDAVETVGLRSSPAGSAVEITVKFRAFEKPMPASSLSSGMLAYLAFVALVRIGDPDASLVAFDEPEIHLHPSLLGRVVALFEALAETQPVVLATHSRRLLDHLSDPKSSVVLCDLEEPSSATRLLRPDPEMLRRWLERYDGLGRAIEEGATDFVMTRAVGA